MKISTSQSIIFRALTGQIESKAQETKCAAQEMDLVTLDSTASATEREVLELRKKASTAGKFALGAGGVLAGSLASLATTGLASHGVALASSVSLPLAATVFVAMTGFALTSMRRDFCDLKANVREDDAAAMREVQNQRNNIEIPGEYQI